MAVRHRGDGSSGYGGVGVFVGLGDVVPVCQVYGRFTGDAVGVLANAPLRFRWSTPGWTWSALTPPGRRAVAIGLTRRAVSNHLIVVHGVGTRRSVYTGRVRRLHRRRREPRMPCRPSEISRRVGPATASLFIQRIGPSPSVGSTVWSVQALMIAATLGIPPKQPPYRAYLADPRWSERSS